MFGEFTLFKHLLIVTTNLVGLSLANHRQFAKFANLSTRQTFSLYGITITAAFTIPWQRRRNRSGWSGFGQTTFSG